MSKAHYIYTKLPLKELEKQVEDHQQDFDDLLNDTFSEEELKLFEKKIDEIGAIFPQPIFSELTFDDFYFRPDSEIAQRSYFESCKSSLCLENLADFHTNPFQVTYLIELIRVFDEILVDQGGVHELEFKKNYLDSLKRYKNIFALLKDTESPKLIPQRPVNDPIELLVREIYAEFERLKTHSLSYSKDDLNPKTLIILEMMEKDILGAHELFKRSGLSPKDFDDYLEKVKFFLRKIKA